MAVPYHLEKKAPIPKKAIFFSLLIGLGFGLLFSFLIRWFVIEPIQVDTVSMEPTLLHGKSYFVHKYIRNFKIGDIVVCKMDAGFVVGRIVGKPGDEIGIVNKALVRNRDLVPEEGQKIIWKDTRPPLPSELTSRDNLEPIRVMEGSFFVLGDNRDEAMDSRTLGPIPKSCIVGTIRE